MSLYIVPTQPDPHWTQTTTLDNVPYILRFIYNQRENTYSLSIQDPVTGSDIISGVKLVSNWPLLQRWAGIGGLPPGELVCASNTTNDAPAGLGELGPGGRVTLYYLDAAFLATGV